MDLWKKELKRKKDLFKAGLEIVRANRLRAALGLDSTWLGDQGGPPVAAGRGLDPDAVWRGVNSASPAPPPFTSGCKAKVSVAEKASPKGSMNTNWKQITY